jgi:hypothetical protein
LTRQRPPGRERLERPKLVRSKMMTRSLCRSCMCIADTPMLRCRSPHLPPAVLAGAGAGEEQEAHEEAAASAIKQSKLHGRSIDETGLWM